MSWTLKLHHSSTPAHRTVVKWNAEIAFDNLAECRRCIYTCWWCRTCKKEKACVFCMLEHPIYNRIACDVAWCSLQPQEFSIWWSNVRYAVGNRITWTTEQKAGYGAFQSIQCRQISTISQTDVGWRNLGFFAIAIFLFYFVCSWLSSCASRLI